MKFLKPKVNVPGLYFLDNQVIKSKLGVTKLQQQATVISNLTLDSRSDSSDNVH